jgi:hypothetical protein
MNLFSSCTNSTKKAIILILLLILLVGCGGNPSNPHGHNPGAPSISNEQSTDFTLNKGAAIDTAGLHIQSSDGIDCGKSLVFATARLTYDSGEIQQMATYVGAAWYGKKSLPPLPPTLTWVPGTLPGGGFCTLALQITNVAQTTVQISHADIRITKPPHQNTYQYHLIDVCKLILCLPGGGGPTPCGGYSVSISLGVEARIDTVFSGEVKPHPDIDHNGNPCNPSLTLTPGQSGELIYYLKPPGRNLIYSAIPELTLETSNGSQILQLSQLAGMLVYTDKSEFTCYAFDRAHQTFVKETNPEQSSCY